MEYGLIGEHLGHSFSKEIHNRIADYDYFLKEIEPDRLKDFITSREYRGLNVTIPYKQDVIAWLDEVDEAALDIGAVNTIVNRDGRLYGYNTDYLGMRELILSNGMDLQAATVLILGSGGTSKTAYKVAESLGANVVIMDMGEVFTSLEQGVVDGQDNPLSTVKSEGWFEVQDYIYNTNHIISSLELFAGEPFWESIDEADRAIFEEAARATSDAACDMYVDQLASDKQFMIDEGLIVTDLTEEDQAKMTEKIQPVYDYLDSQYDWADDVREMIAGIE